MFLRSLIGRSSRDENNLFIFFDNMRFFFKTLSDSKIDKVPKAALHANGFPV